MTKIRFPDNPRTKVVKIHGRTQYFEQFLKINQFVEVYRKKLWPNVWNSSEKTPEIFFTMNDFDSYGYILVA